MMNQLHRLEGRMLLSAPAGAVEAAAAPVAAGRPAVKAMPLAGPAKPVARRPAPVATPLWVNAGGLASVDSLGRQFEGGHGFLGGVTARSPFEVEGTADDPLFWAYREGAAFTFRQAVANGNYALWLEFVEPDHGAEPGRRTFDVTAEGSVLLGDFDIAADAGAPRRAMAKSFDVRVTDRRLDLSFVGVSGNAIVSSIVLIPTDVPDAAKPYTLQRGHHGGDTVAARARNEALKVQSASSLRNLGQRIMLYQNQNKGHYPPDLAALVEYDPGRNFEFGSPRTSTALPRGEMSMLEQRAWVGRLNDYVYLAAGKRGQLPADTPVAYENLDRVIGGVHVLRADGTVRFYERAEAAALLGVADAPPAHPPPLADPAWYGLPRDQAIVQNAGNLRAIASGLLLHANEHRGRFPSDLGTLLATQGMSAATFWNPRAGERPPDGGLTLEQSIDWVNRSAGYVYAAPGRPMSISSDAVVAYENASGVTDGINILFADGRVEFREMRSALETIARSRG